MRHPRAVEALTRLALLVFTDASERLLVDRCVAARDERRHAPDGVCTAAMAGAHELLGVGMHERHGHRHGDTVGQHERRIVAELLDGAEDVVPAAGVEPGRVLAQREQDLLQLERRRDRLDQDRRPDGASGQSDGLLRGRRTRRSRARPRSGPRASRGRRTARCRAPPTRGRSSAGRAPGRTGSPRPGARPRARGARPSAIRAAGRRASRASRRARSACPRARRTRGAPGRVAHAACPATTFAQVGDSASSRQHMNTLAPELSALMTILASAGPVISTRRSSRSRGVLATAHSASRSSRVSSGKDGRSPRRIAARAPREHAADRGDAARTGARVPISSSASRSSSPS